eukprot:5274964-Pyramimonas_sp.AAC.1
MPGRHDFERVRHAVKLLRVHRLVLDMLVGSTRRLHPGRADPRQKLILPVANRPCLSPGLQLFRELLQPVYELHRGRLGLAMQDVDLILRPVPLGGTMKLPENDCCRHSQNCPPQQEVESGPHRFLGSPQASLQDPRPGKKVPGPGAPGRVRTEVCCGEQPSSDAQGSPAPPTSRPVRQLGVLVALEARGPADELGYAWVQVAAMGLHAVAWLLEDPPPIC